MQCVCRASSSFASASVRRSCRSLAQHRSLHATRPRNEVTNFAMPAMSPTMTEGGIAQWKKKEGESFYAGDVLLEVETDKATIDVEAQEDGVLGKILVQDGAKNIPVGKVIALLAEEGDDLSKLEVPKEESTLAAKDGESRTEEPTQTTQTTQPAQPSFPVSHEIQIHHSKPLFPSVQRLLVENGIEDADKIKGTGVRGMLTKGDVLAFLGKASSPMGTYKEKKPELPLPKRVEESKPLDGPAIRRLIASTMLQNSLRARSLPPPTHPYDFDSIIEDYLPPSKPASSTPAVVPNQTSPPTDFLDGLT